MTDKTIIITGVGPTRTLFAELDKIYDVAVYDQGHAQQLAHAHGGRDVKCPMNGAQQALFEKARNDAAIMTADVVKVAKQGLSFSLNGNKPQSLKVESWLSGLMMAHLVDLYVNMRVLDAYVENTEISGIVVHEDVTPKFRALALWGKARSIPVIHIPHNNCYATVRPDIHDQSVADWILASGPYMRDWYAARGFSKERIKITGYPGWDDWADVPLDRARARATLHIEPEETVVTLCTGWPQRTNFVDDHSMTEAMVHLTMDAARDEGWRIIWKLHPGDVQGQEQHGANFAARYGLDAIVTRDHLPYAIKAADVVVSTGPSNVLVEAGLGNVPPALFNLRGYAFDRTPPWVIEPNKEAIKATVNKLVSSDEWAKKRAAFVRRYAFRDDGKAGERAMRQIKRIIND